MGKVHYFNGIVGHTHMLTSAFYVELLDGLLGVAGMMKLIVIPENSLLSTSKLILIEVTAVTTT